MRAWIQTQYGPASTLQLRETPAPTPKSNEVLIDVVAVGVNNGDTRVMLGEPLLVRAVFGLRRPRVATRGMDVVGTIASPSNGFATGQRVVAECGGGGFAEQVAVRADRVVSLPEALSDVNAASLPVAGETAWAALEAARIGEGTKVGATVLVLGASGGVASFVISLALSRGAKVAAVCRPTAVDAVRSWGVDDVRARGSVDPIGANERFDAIIDIAGDRPLRQLRSLLSDGGSAALVTGAGSRLLGPVGRIVRSLFLSRKRARLVSVTQMPKREVLAKLVALATSGTIAPCVTREFAFDQVPEALDAVARGSVVGKGVVHVRP